MGDLSPHFSRVEFACHCGCGKMIVDLRLIEALEALRERIGRPIIVISGCRCAVHNRRKGGVPNSQHLRGRAADLRIAGLSPEEIARHAETIQAIREGGIGLYDTFVHLDVRRNGPARWDQRNKEKPNV